MEEAACGMLPADQRLETAAQSRSQVDLGLVEHAKLARLERPAEVPFQAQSIGCVHSWIR